MAKILRMVVIAAAAQVGVAIRVSSNQRPPAPLYAQLSNSALVEVGGDVGASEVGSRGKCETARQNVITVFAPFDDELPVPIQYEKQPQQRSFEIGKRNSAIDGCIEQCEVAIRTDHPYVKGVSVAQLYCLQPRSDVLSLESFTNEAIKKVGDDEQSCKELRAKIEVERNESSSSGPGSPEGTTSTLADKCETKCNDFLRVVGPITWPYLRLAAAYCHAQDVRDRGPKEFATETIISERDFRDPTARALDVALKGIFRTRSKISKLSHDEVDNIRGMSSVDQKGLITCARAKELVMEHEVSQRNMLQTNYPSQPSGNLRPGLDKLGKGLFHTCVEMCMMKGPDGKPMGSNAVTKYCSEGSFNATQIWSFELYERKTKPMEEQAS